jgi:hypothetical protein
MKRIQLESPNQPVAFVLISDPKHDRATLPTNTVGLEIIGE